ncbi:MAG: ATPase [Clostridiales bacterium]|jgi:vacuolar-type H+-ATPase subunit H|nr:ATPase [Clostridiales bacterium]
MDSVLKYLDMVEDLLESSKSVPFSGKVSVEKEKIYDIIDEIRLNIPNEIRQSQRIIAEHDKVIADAKAKATTIVKEAEERALKLIDEHEIYKQALEEGNDIIEESKKSARDMRLNAMDYADEILAKTEEIVRESLESISKQNSATEDFFNRTIDVLYSNRMELRGVKK